MENVTATGASATTSARRWPSRPVAYFGLGMIVLATMLNFFDGTVFMMMVERIKVDFGLSDEQLGWLLGPANVIFYVLVGIPLARLVGPMSRRWLRFPWWPQASAAPSSTSRRLHARSACASL